MNATTQPRPDRHVLWRLAALVAVAVAVGVAIVAAGGGETNSADTEAIASFGPVTLRGTALPPFTSREADPAVGLTAPVLVGRTPSGADIEVGAGEATLVVFLAHWCPHCQRELPRLVDQANAGGFDGIRTIAVLTGSNPNAPNYPPVAWLDREGWTGEIMLDSVDSAAADAFGLSSYPYLVILDAGGSVVARNSGELTAAQVDDMVAEVT